MDRRIRQIAGLITVLLLAVTASAGWIQGIRAESIAANEPGNPRTGEVARNRFRIFQECRWERGPILSIDGQVLAESIRTGEGRRCLYERVYRSGDLVPHVVGQWSLHFGKSGLEEAYNEDLVGAPPPPRTLTEVFQQRPRIGNTVVATVDTRLQETAIDQLRGRRGGVVALNPKTGAVLVAASVPSYDPNDVASNDRDVAIRARCELGVPAEKCKNPNSPMRSVALQEQKPPGSSFKVVTAAAALESGKYTPDSPTLPFRSRYTAPGDTRSIGNYGGGSCGGSLTAALRRSCNTAFAQIANDIGADQLRATAAAMGLDQKPAFGAERIGCEADYTSDISETWTGCVPSEIVRGDASNERLETPGYRARAGFGQWVVEASPFGMAVVAGTVANGGFVPRPRFAERIIDRTGATVHQVRTGVGPSAISPETAGELSQMMRSVVTSGTAASALGGFRPAAAGKTGTAQVLSCSPDEVAIFGAGCGRLPHAWFIAFAPVDDPTIAIAVLVERGGGGSESATGGRIAAPIAREVMERYFDLYPVDEDGDDA